MANGEWVTQRQRKESREQIREAKRRLTIEFADKLWLAQNHPCGDEVLAWLSENRAEASKIGSSRWHLETLPDLHQRQQQLRQAAAFQEVLDRAKVSTQTLTVDQVLAAAGSPQIPQDQLGKTENAAQPAKRSKRKDAGKAQPSRKVRTPQG
jgi:hypothetical protein